MKGSRGRRLSFALVVALTLAAFAPTAQAGCSITCYQPDARVRLLGGVLKGNNIYNTTASGQTVSQLANLGTTRQIVVSIQNDGTVNDSFTLSFSAFAGNFTDFTPVYTVGWLAPQDITFSIHTASFTTPTLTPGQVFYARVYVHVAGTANPGLFRQDTLNVQSTGNTSKNDRVAWKVTAK